MYCAYHSYYITYYQDTQKADEFTSERALSLLCRDFLHSLRCITESMQRSSREEEHKRVGTKFS